MYYVFVIPQIQEGLPALALDINIRNLNLNGKFGFELEGVFLEELEVLGGDDGMLCGWHWRRRRFGRLCFL